MAGTALDADGQPHDVVVDEARVVDLLADTSGGYLDASEISAAARALAEGDPAPLLRMAAETELPWFVDQGDPRFYSDGDFAATFCTDGVFPFVEVRRRGGRAAPSTTPPSRACRASVFAPFSVPGVARSHVAPADDCAAWPAERREHPAIPRGASFPAVPALALAGDLRHAPCPARTCAPWPRGSRARSS